MKKSDVLALGCGGCGNAQLDVFLGLDKRYTGIFMNTNLSEMETLEHFNRERRCFYIPNADGCGKNRDLCETYIKEEAPKFVEMIKKFTNQSTILFFGAGDGGTGSKAMIMLAKLIKSKHVCPEKSINIVATLPNIGEGIISFSNAIDFWNELIDLKNKGIVDSIQFIDNNQSIDEKEINVRSMKELDMGFNISEYNTDTTDSKRVHTTKGYKVILNLDNDIKDFKKAVDVAIGKSMFYIPEKLNCDVLVGTINTKVFNKDDVDKNYKAYDFEKINENVDGNSTLVFGNCSMPKEAIELIQEAKSELESRKRSRINEDYDDLKIRTDKKNTSSDKSENTSSKVSSNELNDMFEDDSFWD